LHFLVFTSSGNNLFPTIVLSVPISLIIVQVGAKRIGNEILTRRAEKKKEEKTNSQLVGTLVPRTKWFGKSKR
jgi:hypothetical protein